MDSKGNFQPLVVNSSPGPNPSDDSGWKSDAFNPPTRPKLQHRRYSSEWWAYRWDKEVVRGFLPRIVYVVVGFLLMGIWVGLIFLFANRQTKQQQRNAIHDIAIMQAAQDLVPNLIVLKGELRQFDSTERSLIVQWSAVSLNDDNSTFSPLGTNESNTVSLGLYRDVQAIFDSNITQAMNDGGTYYMLDNITSPRLGVVGAHEWDSVATDIDMAAQTSGDVWSEPLFGYPWDVWTGNIVLVSNVLNLADLAQNFTGKFALTYSGITVSGNVLNWKIEATTEVSSECDNPDIPEQDRVCALTVTFWASRPGIVKFCVLLVVIVNWISTVAIFLLTGEAILLRRTHILEGTDILGVCFSALFALPTVRSLLPGAPDQFGAIIDLVGILPNVIIISLCTTIFSAAKLQLRLKQAMQRRSTGKQE